MCSGPSERAGTGLAAVATQMVADAYGAVSYGPFDVLGLFPSIALGLMALLLQGVLKGGTVTALVATLGLCVACVPLGVRLLRAEAGSLITAPTG